MNCSSGKITFFARTIAKRSAKKIKAMGNMNGQVGGHTLRPYRCRECGAWHLTSHVPGKPRTKRGVTL